MEPRLSHLGIAVAAHDEALRFWRDLHFASRHNALNSRPSLELYGRGLLGQPSNLMLLTDIRDEV